MLPRIEPLFNKIIYYIDWCISKRYYLGICLFVLLVAGKFHGSSIGMWDTYLKEKTPAYSTVTLVGVERPIRSDEWIVGTPWMLAQCMTKEFFPAVNKNIRSTGQDMLLVHYNPVANISLLGRPANWGFLLFGKDHGLSWWWFLRLFLLFFSSFELLYILTSRDKALSIVGAFGITFAPAVQWWFSHPLVDILYSAQWSIIALYYFITENKFKLRIWMSLLLVIFSIGFVFSLYPPFQVPMGYIVLILIFYMLISKKWRGQFSLRDWLLAGGAVLIVMATVTYLLYYSRDAINLMLNTAYPGQRLVQGGGFSPALMNLFLIDWLIPYKGVTFLNNCEVSTFLNFMPACVPVIALVAVNKLNLEKKLKYIILALFVFWLFQLAWFIWGFPVFLARASAFSYTIPQRVALLSFNLTGLYLSILLLHITHKQKIFSVKINIFIILATIAFYAWSIMSSPMKAYLPKAAFILILIFMLLILLSFFQGLRKMSFVLILLYTIVAGFPVNPIARGVSSIYDKKITEKIMEIKRSDATATWAVLNSYLYGNYLVSLGIKAFNSVQLYPDIKQWQMFDPQGKYRDIYNRYSNVHLFLTDKPTYFAIIYQDCFSIYLNYKDIPKSGITYFISDVNIAYKDQFALLHYFAESKLYIYKYNGTAGH